MKVLIISLAIFLLFIGGLFACDMMGMLSIEGYDLKEIYSFPGSYPNSHGGNDISDYFMSGNSFFMHQLGENDHGYGIVYYKDLDQSIINLPYNDNNAQVFRSEDSSDSDASSPYGYAKRSILDQNGSINHATILLAHNRQASMNPYIDDPHPFIWNYESTTNPDMPHFTFEHNGTITSSNVLSLETMIEGLYPNWFTDYPTYTNTIGDLVRIDSEIYFHWIMANIKYVDGNILLGLHNAVKAMATWCNSEKNFIFSDGSALYAYRDYGNSTGTDYYLGYYDGLEEDNNPFRAVRSDYANTTGLTEISNTELTYIPRKGDIIRYMRFNTSTNEISGNIFNDLSPQGFNNTYYVTGDITVNNSISIDSDVNVYFLTESEFTINGQVTIEANASLNLSHSSEIIINNNGILSLDWGSTISGFTPTTYPNETTTIPGDRIIAKDGGIISTGDLQNPGNTVTIKSSSGELWDGIHIETPTNGQNYWFVNCDISGIKNLSAETTQSARTRCNLNLYYTNFHDAGQIVVRDGHKLTMHGTDTNYSYIQNTEASIEAYESPVDLNYVWVGGAVVNDNLGNGSGIYLYNSASQNSKIKNCKFQYNNDNGITTNSVAFDEFNNNTVQENSKFGMMCYAGTSFSGTNPFKNIALYNNGFAEYAGYQQTFKMDDQSANIIIDDDYFTSGLDNYLLMNLNWNQTDAVNIKGTNIYSLNHLFPTNSLAWSYFPQPTGSKDLLDLAEIDFANENYTAAQVSLYQIMNDYLYSPEATTAIYYLYHIEVLTQNSCGDLRTYLSSINVNSNSALYNVIQLVYAKTLVKDKEYQQAINLLEDIILNSDVPDEVITAMIDQGYAYLKLAESGERSLPDSASVKPSNLNEYQDIVKKLTAQFSYYRENENTDTTPIAAIISLAKNYPNPFNPNTIISYNLAADSQVELTVYNVKGQKVKTLISTSQQAGSKSVEWNGKDDNNNPVSSGIYFYKIKTSADVKMSKMILMK